MSPNPTQHDEQTSLPTSAMFNYTASHFFSPDSMSNDSVTFTDDFSANPHFQQLQTELRSLLLIEARSSDPTGANTPEQQTADTSTSRTGTSLYMHQISDLHIPQCRIAKYLSIWTTECAPWLDMFDQAQHFGLSIPIVARASPALLSALLALSARQAERRDVTKNSAKDSLALYSKAISSLSSVLSSRQPEVAVTACILCVLEMMSVSPHNWRRHAEGCATLFQAMNVHGFSGGLLQATFWCYARMDLVSIIVADGAERTVLPLVKWVPQDTFATTTADNMAHLRQAAQTFLEHSKDCPDMHANYAVYLCAQAYELLALRTRYTELGEENGYNDDLFGEFWFEIWSHLQQWFEERPPQFLPVNVGHDSTYATKFPKLFFPYWPAISSTQLYHVACLLMLDISPVSERTSVDLVDKQLWHARSIVGISLSNAHKGCLNNAVQPLYVAGRIFTSREEQKIISQLLASIEETTGWGSRWRVRDLELAWGRK